MSESYGLPVRRDERPQIQRRYTEEIAEWAYELQFQDLPEEVVDKVKYMALDFVGQAIGGVSGKGQGDSTLAGDKALLRMVSLRPGDCTVIGAKKTVLPEYAAWINALTGRVLCVDDTHRWSIPTHLGQTAYGTAFAMSETVPTDFPTFATAVVIGHEVTAKLGMALQPRVYAIDAVEANTMGAVLQAAKILHLSKEQFVDCLGVAGFYAAGSMEYYGGRGSWPRMANYGWAGHTGILAALAVREGFPGQARMVEGPWGFLLARSTNPDWDILDRFGEPYEILRDAVKIYPTARNLSNVVDCVLQLVREHSLDAIDVAEVVVEMPEQLWMTTGTENRRHLTVTEEHLVSAYYWTAVPLLKKRAWFSEIEPEVFHAEETKEMMRRVQCIINDEFTRGYPDKLTTAVTVKTRDGRSHRVQRDYPKGEPEDPLTWEELVRKYDAIYDYCSRDLMSEERAAEIKHRVMSMEKEQDIGRLCKIFASDR